MAAEIIPIQEWLQSFRGAADELARTSLRFDRNPAAAGEGEGEPGAYIAILSPNNAVHLGLSAKPDQCRALARALLGLRQDETLSETDVFDGPVQRVSPEANVGDSTRFSSAASSDALGVATTSVPSGSSTASSVSDASAGSLDTTRSSAPSAGRIA